MQPCTSVSPGLPRPRSSYTVPPASRAPSASLARWEQAPTLDPDDPELRAGLYEGEGVEQVARHLIISVRCRTVALPCRHGDRTCQPRRSSDLSASGSAERAPDRAATLGRSWPEAGRPASCDLRCGTRRSRPLPDSTRQQPCPPTTTEVTERGHDHVPLTCH